MKKPLIEEVFYIKDHVYQDTVSVIFTDNLNKAIKQQCKMRGFSPKRYLVDDDTGAVVEYVKEKNYTASWVLFDINKYKESTVVHECLHLAHHLLEPRGLKLKDSTSEAYAYLIEFLFTKITGFYEEMIDKFAKENEANSKSNGIGEDTILRDTPVSGECSSASQDDTQRN